MVRLELAGPDTKLLSTLCAACPYSSAGCCVAPPRLDLADIARVVCHGGRDWLVAEVAAGRLVRHGDTLVPTRIKREPARGQRREATCVYHSPTGCTIPHDRRSATCNYYLCESALSEHPDDPAAPEAREAHTRLTEQFATWEAELASRVAARWPDGAPFDAEMFDWLGATFTELSPRE